MYLLSILAVLLASLIMMCFSAGGIGEIYYFGDLWSFLILLIICVPILIGSGLWKDFNNAFRLAGRKKKETTLLEVKRAIEAFSLVIKTLLAAGCFIVIFSVILLLTDRSLENYVLQINLSVAVLPLLYVFAIIIFLLPIEARLKVRLNELLQH